MIYFSFSIFFFISLFCLCFSKNCFTNFLYCLLVSISLISMSIFVIRSLPWKGLPWWLSWYRNCLQCRRPQFDPWVGKIRWRRDRLPTPVFLGFPCGSAGKESTCNVGDLSLIPRLGWSPGEGKGYPLQYSGLENFMDYIFHGTWLRDFHFTPSMNFGLSFVFFFF